MRRRALLGLGASALAAPALAGGGGGPPPRAAHVFVRIDFEGAFPIQIDPAADPGRLEVWSGDSFVGCALAPVHEDRWDYSWLCALSVGFVAPGPASAVRVKTFGELNRFAKAKIKITEQAP